MGAGHCVPTQQSITPLSHWPYELASLSARFTRSQRFNGRPEPWLIELDHMIFTCMPRVASCETRNVPLGIEAWSVVGGK